MLVPTMLSKILNHMVYAYGGWNGNKGRKRWLDRDTKEICIAPDNERGSDGDMRLAPSTNHPQSNHSLWKSLHRYMETLE